MDQTVHPHAAAATLGERTAREAWLLGVMLMAAANARAAELEDVLEDDDREPGGPICGTCGGTGDDDHGRACYRCRGTGELLEDDPDESHADYEFDRAKDERLDRAG